MMRRLGFAVALLTALRSSAPAAPTLRLSALPEFVRPDPFGAIVPPDRSAHVSPAPRIQLSVPRAGYASCHLLISGASSSGYTLNIEPPSSARSLSVEASREWFHFVPAAESYYPDALIPVALPYRSSLPDPENRIANQTVAAFWVDFWAPADLPPGNYRFSASLRSGKASVSLPFDVQVLSAVVPAEDAIDVDHNSYGTSWFAAQYPDLLRRSGPGFWESQAFFDLLHAYHRVFYEHRGTFHQLGYGHAGKVGPEFAPVLEGSGASKHIVNWTLYDRHYGPLFDGSAFAHTHRGTRPIPSVYLPINPEWPASFEWWNEPGYEREFVNVVSAMEQHFREHGWTHTNFEMFFNHKKRYRGFSWDGDEARFPKDYSYLREYARLLKQSLPPASPVHFVFRADASWTMERQWRELAGIINFWVCGGGMFSWYPDAPRKLRDRGDIVWTYGGTPAVTEAASAIAVDVLRTWMQNVQGFVRWETTAPGPDPWFHFSGGTENLVYPGDRFGIAAPLSSVRLKLERNVMQDVNLLETAARGNGRARMENGVAQAFNRTSPSDWWTPRPALANTNPEDWSNADVEDASATNTKFGKQLDAAAEQRVRAFLYQALREQP